MNLEAISQIGIGILTISSIFALAHKHYRMGFILGMLSEPFWLYSSFNGALWGMFVVALFTTYGNIRGLINHSEKKV